MLAVLAGGAPWSTSLRGQELAASYFHHHVGWNVPGAAEERPWIERVEHGGSLLVRARMVRRPIGPTNPLPGSINAPGRQSAILAWINFLIRGPRFGPPGWRDHG